MNRFALFSVPRSGSSWLGEILNSSPNVIYKFQPNIAYSFDLELKANSSKYDIDNFFLKLINSDDDFINSRLSISGKKREFYFSKENQSTLIFKETHFLNVISNLLKKSDIKIIGLIRSPFAVLNSWINIPKEFNPKWDVKKEWKDASKKNNSLDTHYFGYNKWKEACFMFLDFKKKYPNRFYLVNYDELLKNTNFEVKNLFDFCQIDFPKQTYDFIKKTNIVQSEDAYSVFKTKKNDLNWKKTLPNFIKEEIKNDPDFKLLNKYFKWI